MELPEGLKLFEHLSRITEPMRLRDFHSHTRALGLPEFRPPMAVSPVLTFLAAPIRHLGESVGAFYVGEKEVEFTPEDEETLVMFASQAALVIANARRHREERRARAGLETLVNTTPVGVLVFDARTGDPVSLNREARRIVNWQERRLRMVLSVSAACRGVGRNQGCGTCEAPGPWHPWGLLGGLGADLGRPLWLSLARWAGLRFCRPPAFGAALPRRAKENAGGIHRRLVSVENPGKGWRIDRSSSGSFASSLT